jgi:DNA-directed RNA polymerase specialized sigma24 family protein
LKPEARERAPHPKRPLARFEQRLNISDQGIHAIPLAENLPHRGYLEKLSDFGGGGCLLDEMHDRSDAQLLRAYVDASSDDAFTALVARHTNAVYSAALRQTASPDLARDVAQSVFTDLARKASGLAAKTPPDASLLGWLYTSVRYAALNALRDNRRRLHRERESMLQLDSNSGTDLKWEDVSPVDDGFLKTATTDPSAPPWD